MNINEIARLSGVSIGTVDRVIHKRGRVSKKTEERVKRVITETAYEPNPLARQLKQKKPHKVACLMPAIDTENGYWVAVLDGMERAIKEELRGFAFSVEMYSFGRRDRGSLYDAWQAMKASDAYAFIIAPVMQEEILCLFKNDNDERPCCFVDTNVPGLNPLCAIGQNPYQAGTMAGKLTYLTSKRPGKFIVVSTDTEAYNLNERARGFMKWMSDNNLTSQCIFCDGEEVLCETVHSALESGEISGVCIVSASTSIGAKAVCEAGLRDKVSVVGFDMVDANRAALEKGEVDALIYQRPSEQGYLAMMQIYHQAVLQDNIEDKIDIPIDVYFKENLYKGNRW